MMIITQIPYHTWPLAATLLAVLSAPAHAQSTRSAFGIAEPLLPSPPIENTRIIIMDVRDYNGDDLDDLLCYSYDFEGEGQFVWVVYAVPDGGYENGFMYEIPDRGTRHWGAAAAQIDQDPELELIYRRNTDFNYEIYQEDGSRTAVEIDDFNDVSFGDGSYGLVIEHADLDGDGIEDVFFNSTRGNLFSRWSSLKDGQKHTQLEDDLFDGDTLLYEPADINADGNLDLLLHVLDIGQLVLIEGTGTTTWGDIRTIDAVPPTLDEEDLPLPASLDANPLTDFVQRGPGENEITVYYNAAGPQPSTETFELNDSYMPTAVLPDMDGNNEPELAVQRRYLNSSTTAESFIVFDFLTSERELSTNELGVTSQGISAYNNDDAWPVKRVWATDLDRDGDPEPLVLNGIRGAYAFLNDIARSGRDSFGPEAYEIETGYPLHVLPLNLDQDSNSEFVVSNNFELITLDTDMSQGTVVPNTSGAFMAVSADLDGDSQDEVIATNQYAGQLRILVPDGAGGLSLDSLYPIEIATSIMGLVAADFDEDGRDDLAISLYEQGIVRILSGTDGPTVLFRSDLGGYGANQVIKPGVLDFNNDGHLDLAIGLIREKVIELHAGDGTGQFSLVHTIPDTNPYWITPADINADGFTDLAVGHFSNSMAVHYLGEDGSPLSKDEWATGSVNEVIVRDVDADGDQDIIASTSGFSAGVSSVYFQDDQGDFDPENSLDYNRFAATGIATVDADRDGAEDLIVVSGDDGKLRIHYGIPDADPCPADLNNDGELNFFDISAFLTDQPDYNGDGEFNFFDVPAFIQDFNAGCP